MSDVDLVDLVAVVNHLGERLLINREDYLRGQWQLWEEPVSSSTEPEEAVDESSPEPSVLQPTTRRKRKGDPFYPDRAVL
jgi:hypothetical protein